MGASAWCHQDMPRFCHYVVESEIGVKLKGNQRDSVLLNHCWVYLAMASGKHDCKKRQNCALVFSFVFCIFYMSDVCYLCVCYLKISDLAFKPNIFRKQSWRLLTWLWLDLPCARLYLARNLTLLKWHFFLSGPIRMVSNRLSPVNSFFVLQGSRTCFSGQVSAIGG